MKAKVIWGHELPKEAWLNAAERIKNVAPAIADNLRQKNFEGQGEQDAEDFMTDMQLAYMAMCYVANYARDKCRIIPVPKKLQGRSLSMRMSSDELNRILANNPALKVHDQGKVPEKKRIAIDRDIEFESDAEKRFYHSYVFPNLLAGFIIKYETHKSFEVIPSITFGGKKYKNRIYTPDFILEYADGSIEVVEVKGRVVKKLQRDYPLRRQLFIMQYCIPNGWRFREVHDDEI